MRHVQSVSFDVYLKRSNASSSVKRKLLATYNKLQAEGIDETTYLSKAQLRSYTTRSSFVKVENNLYRSPLGRKRKAPRLIQGATPEFIVLVGPWIMALQDLLKKRWDLRNEFMCFTSGISSENLADFISKHDGHVLEDDLGKFDCSIREPWCKLEVWLCKQFGAPIAVLNLMYANIKTHGFTHHGWQYKCNGTRKSGDPYTSLMNSIINGLSHLYIYCDERKITVSQAMTTHKILMLLQGDDNLMRHGGPKIDWRKRMAGLGFDSEAVYRSGLCEAEFCSNRLYELKRGWIFGPKPGKVLAKYGYIVNPPPRIDPRRLMRGVALGLRSNCNFIPPLKTVIDRTLSLTEGVKAFFQPGFQEHVVKVSQLHESTVEVLRHLNEQYDWDADKQRAFSKRVDAMQLGDPYDHPFADLLFDRDTSGPQLVFSA
jgi:hypothetical protein